MTDWSSVLPVSVFATDTWARPQVHSIRARFDSGFGEQDRIYSEDQGLQRRCWVIPGSRLLNNPYNCLQSGSPPRVHGKRLFAKRSMTELASPPTDFRLLFTFHFSPFTSPGCLKRILSPASQASVLFPTGIGRNLRTPGSRDGMESVRPRDSQPPPRRLHAPLTASQSFQPETDKGSNNRTESRLKLATLGAASAILSAASQDAVLAHPRSNEH